MSTATMPDVHSAQINLSEDELQNLSSMKAFFGHQSVGRNILDGVRSMMAEDPRLKLNLVRSSEPASVRGPAFIDAEIGANGDPLSKNAAFAAALRAGLGREGGVAFYKYCYVDITDTTNVAKLFEDYRRDFERLRAAHPEVTFIHVTTPLTTVEPAAKAWLKNVLGRHTARAANEKRNEFNDLLRRTYAEDSIFDLAKVESTRPDGTRSYFQIGDKPIYSLAEEYTPDGGHLNSIGSEAAARELLKTLAKAAKRN